MVGACKTARRDSALSSTNMSSRVCPLAQRVDGSGERDGSLHAGGLLKGIPRAIRSQACRRQSTLKCPEGASQLQDGERRAHA